MVVKNQILSFGVVSFVLIYSAIVYSKEKSKFSNHAEYYVSDMPLSWDESRSYCLAMNMSLLTVKNVRKDEELVELFTSSGNGTLPGNLWTAGKERVEGVWHWDNGLDATPFYHTRWFVGQPDDLTALNCVYLANSALLYWRDANCSAPMYFACE